MLGDVSVGEIFFLEQVSDPFLVGLPLCPAFPAGSTRVEEVCRVCSKSKGRGLELINLSAQGAQIAVTCFHMFSHTFHTKGK